MSGYQPGAAGWEARTLPQCYAAPQVFEELNCEFRFWPDIKNSNVTSWSPEADWTEGSRLRASDSRVTSLRPTNSSTSRTTESAAPLLASTATTSATPTTTTPTSRRASFRWRRFWLWRRRDRAWFPEPRIDSAMPLPLPLLLLTMSSWPWCCCYCCCCCWRGWRSEATGTCSAGFRASDILLGGFGTKPTRSFNLTPL